MVIFCVPVLGGRTQFLHLIVSCFEFFSQQCCVQVWDSLPVNDVCLLLPFVFCTVAFCLESFSFPSGIWVILHPHSYFTHCPIGLLFSSQRWTPSWICLSCIEPKDNMCQNSFSAIVFSPDHPHAPFVTVKYCQWDFFFPVFRKSSMGTRSSLLAIF